jgi:hypothetical protein
MARLARPTDCLIAGPQDDQSDDRAGAGEQVAEADAECPHAHVGDVVGLDMEESSHSWAIEEEQLEGCGCDVDHRADERDSLGEAVHGVADVARLWVRGRARIPDSPSRLNQDVAAGDDEAVYIESFRCRLRRGCTLIASQLPHQRKDDVGVGAVIVLF